jgi:hypothetical protein
MPTPIAKTRMEEELTRGIKEKIKKNWPKGWNGTMPVPLLGKSRYHQGMTNPGTVKHHIGKTAESI